MVPVLVNQSVGVLSEEFITEAALPLLLSEVHDLDVAPQCRTATQHLSARFADVVNFVTVLSLARSSCNTKKCSLSVREKVDQAHED